MMPDASNQHDEIAQERSRLQLRAVTILEMLISHSIGVPAFTGHISISIDIAGGKPLMIVPRVEWKENPA